MGVAGVLETSSIGKGRRPGCTVGQRGVHRKIIGAGGSAKNLGKFPWMGGWRGQWGVRRKW